MVARRVLGLIAMVLTTLALLHPPEVQARRRWECRSDKQCAFGTCNDAGICCTGLAGQVACGTGCCNTLLGNTCCDKTCIDTKSNNANCGSCGNACSGGHLCQNGACVCPEGTVECGGECVDTTFDNFNCGSCGNACGTGQICVDSACQCTDAAKLLCNGQCVDGLSDPNNCGACGNVCPTGVACVAGDCQECPPLTILCGDQCVWASGDDGGFCCEWQGTWHTCVTGIMQCAGDSCCAAGIQVCAHPDGNVQCCQPGWVCAPGGGCCDPAPYPECQGWWCCYNL